MQSTYYDELFYDNGQLGYAGMCYERGDTFIKHGRGKLYRKNGTLWYEGDFKDGKWHGRGKLYHENGTLWYEGDFKDDKWHGRGKLYYEDGTLWYEGDFRDDKQAGKGREYSENSTLVYEGDFKDDKWHGRGKLYRENGTLQYEGDFKDDEWHGQGKLYYEDGTLCYEGDFRDSEANGKGKSYAEDGTLLYEGDFKDNEWHGWGKKYDEDGTLFYEGDFKDSNRHGIGKLYRENGTLLYEGDFRDDEEAGKGRYYREDGTLAYEGEFQNGAPVGQITPVKQATERTLSDCLEDLDTMIGLMEVKAQVHSLINLIRLQKERQNRGLPSVPMSYHLVFTGNPGTGKTTVARLLAEIYANLGVISKGMFVETDRTGMVAGYLGQTAIKTEAIIEKAKGGILFIDEAYSLAQEQGDSYGIEAIDCLMKRMEDYRDDFVVIVAGYQEPMERFLEANPGMKSRFKQYIHFVDYNTAELMQILDSFCDKNGYTLQKECRESFEKHLDQQMKDPVFMKNFSNGRYIRNLFEKMIVAQGNRLATANISAMNDQELNLITIQDLNYIIGNHEFEKTS